MKKITALLVVSALFSWINALATPYVQQLCDEFSYHCINAKRGDTWEKLFPDEHQADIVRRVNRTNTAIYPRRLIAIPNNLNQLTLMDVAPFIAHDTEITEKTVVVSLKEQAFGAYNEQGRLIYWGPISSARGWCPDQGSSCGTPTGAFKIFRKNGPDYVSSRFPLPNGGAPMPYAMHFYGGYALHAGPNELPGYPASHGCVRLFTEDARWLNEEFTTYGTLVLINA